MARGPKRGTIKARRGQNAILNRMIAHPPPRGNPLEAGACGDGERARADRRSAPARLFPSPRLLRARG